ncbi:MAG: hypothetical protein ACE5HH_01255 [Candidatus Hydrothermarchaeales archaeon]
MLKEYLSPEEWPRNSIISLRSGSVRMPFPSKTVETPPVVGGVPPPPPGPPPPGPPFPEDFIVIECLEGGNLLPPQIIHQKIIKIIKEKLLK